MPPGRPGEGGAWRIRTLHGFGGFSHCECLGGGFGGFSHCECLGGFEHCTVWEDSTTGDLTFWRIRPGLARARNAPRVTVWSLVLNCIPAGDRAVRVCIVTCTKAQNSARGCSLRTVPCQRSSRKREKDRVPLRPARPGNAWGQGIHVRIPRRIALPRRIWSPRCPSLTCRQRLWCPCMQM